MSRSIRLQIGGSDFKQLVSGKSVFVSPSEQQVNDLDLDFVPEIELQLADIGFQIMKAHIEEAERNCREAPGSDSSQ